MVKWTESKGNQNSLRSVNRMRLLDELLKSPKTYTELARALGLSNTAVAKIADDLLQANILQREETSGTKNGIVLRVNPGRGCIAAADFAGTDILVCLVNLGSRILQRRTVKNVVVIRKSHLIEVRDRILEMLGAEKLREEDLLEISIASPGRIDLSTGNFRIAPRFENDREVNLFSFFGERFCCPVSVKNDISLALAGEVEFGAVLKGCRNVLMLHIDIGTGSALLLNGKLFEGSNGAAGEIGYYSLDSFAAGTGAFARDGYENEFDNVSLFAIGNVLRHFALRGEPTVLSEYGEINAEAIASAYLGEDALTRRVVDGSAAVVGSVAKNLAEFLDLDMVVLNGAIVEFGDRYLDIVRERINRKIVTGPIHVAFSDLTERATIVGAISIGRKDALERLVQRIGESAPSEETEA